MGKFTQLNLFLTTFLSMVNEVAFFSSISYDLLSVQKTIEFLVLTLYPTMLLNLSIVLRVVWWCLSGFLFRRSCCPQAVKNKEWSKGKPKIKKVYPKLEGIENQKAVN